jgi:nucleotide-binding universal stress UspA family protein
MYTKVLLAYDGSIEGRRALREGAKLAQLCRAEVFLLAVVELPSVVTSDAGLAIPIGAQTANFESTLAEGVERLMALGFSPTARLEAGDPGQKIADVAGATRRCWSSPARAVSPMVVRVCRQLLGQASPLQRPGRSN